MDKNKKEYIEREAVMKVIEQYGCSSGSTLGHHSGAVDVIGNIISKIPVADVIPIVRCKDCKYNGTQFCITFSENPNGADNQILKDNAFSSWGEREEGK